MRGKPRLWMVAMLMLLRQSLNEGHGRVGNR
jgi:hypothetical protein